MAIIIIINDIYIAQVRKSQRRVAKVRVSSFKYYKWAYSMFPAYSVKARNSSFNTRNPILD